MVRVNIGCGRTPIPGWENFDNSLSVRLATIPAPIWNLLTRSKLVNAPSRDFARAARDRGIRWADATRRIPIPSRTADALYSCHMFEHLGQDQAHAFLLEVKRVLRPGGVLRLAVPDLERIARRYLDTSDADEFLRTTLLVMPYPENLKQKLKYLWTGPRLYHQWLYDERSLCRFLASVGFCEPRAQPPGQTLIDDPGELDLRERAEESIYVEAVAPD